MGNQLTYYGWAGSIDQFLSLKKDQWLSALIDYSKQRLNEDPQSSQIAAWTECFDSLTSSFIDLKKISPKSLDLVDSF